MPSHFDILQLLILKTCRLYNVFGSGSRHGVYAQFMVQSALVNNGKRIGLLRGAGTRFASFFYGMIRLLRLRRPLLATIHEAKFTSLDLNDQCRSAVIDIEDKTFWKALYTLLRALYPSIRALRYCDSNKPAMDKIAFLVERTTQAITRSCSLLDDRILFRDIGETDSNLQFEENDVFGNGNIINDG